MSDSFHVIPPLSRGDRAVLLLAVAELCVFSLWIIGELSLAPARMAAAHDGVRSLFIAQTVFTWIVVHLRPPASWRTHLERAAFLLLVPLPLHVLLYLMGGIDAPGFLAVQMVCGSTALAGLLLSRAIVRSIRRPYARDTVLLLAQFLPALWIFAQRQVFTEWLMQQ